MSDIDDDAWLTQRRAVLAFRKANGINARAVGDGKPRQHGVASYNKGCRCDDCKAAKRNYRQKRRARLWATT